MPAALTTRWHGPSPTVDCWLILVSSPDLGSRANEVTAPVEPVGVGDLVHREQVPVRRVDGEEIRVLQLGGERRLRQLAGGRVERHPVDALALAVGEGADEYPELRGFRRRARGGREAHRGRGHQHDEKPTPPVERPAEHHGRRLQQGQGFEEIGDHFAGGRVGAGSSGEVTPSRRRIRPGRHRASSRDKSRPGLPGWAGPSRARGGRARWPGQRPARDIPPVPSAERRARVGSTRSP